MTVQIQIPTPLRPMTGDKAAVEVSAETVGEALEALSETYPDLKERIFDAKGQIRRFVNVFHNGEDIRFGDGAATVVADGDEIAIIPAIAGG